MNYYIVTEGKRTERKIYPAWLTILAPHLTQVRNANEATDDNFYLFSAEGYPDVLDDVGDAADTIWHDMPQYGCLIVILDSEEETVEQRRIIVSEIVQKAVPKFLDRFRLEIVVQHRCIESWLLGNRRIFPSNPQDPQLRQFIDYYNVRDLDPELSGPQDFNTHAQFHLQYLRLIFAERNETYSKTRPGPAIQESYVQQLRERVSKTPHLATLAEFFNLARRMCSHDELLARRKGKKCQ